MASQTAIEQSTFPVREMIVEHSASWRYSLVWWSYLQCNVKVRVVFVMCPTSPRVIMARKELKVFKALTVHR